jgi:hypothetical protein
MPGILPSRSGGAAGEGTVRSMVEGASLLAKNLISQWLLSARGVPLHRFAGEESAAPLASA